VQKALVERIAAQPWLNASFLTPVVNDGAVDLWGYVGSEEQRGALYVLVEEVAGPREIRDHMRRFEDAA
jgi:hypothetical protein